MQTSSGAPTADPRSSAGTKPEPTPRAARRIDPERKARILSATVDVLAEHGVAGTTHRRIAAQAGVPLAALTYHFASLADLLAQGFGWYTAAQSVRFAAHFEHVASHEQLVEALVDIVIGDPADGSAVVGFELHLAALRDPSLRTIIQSWTQASREVLGRFTDPDSAADLDALLEGLILHRLLAPAPISRDRARATVLRGLPPRSDSTAASAS